MSATPIHRAMLFVDGSNLLIEMGTHLGVRLRAERATSEMFTLASLGIHTLLHSGVAAGVYGPHRIVRKYWFGSTQGSAEEHLAASTRLRSLGFDAALFQKRKGKAEKGVDLAVAREMLIHAFNKNYDAAILVAGDEDYVELVNDVKRLGRVVIGSFFESSALSPKLKLAFDDFAPFHVPVHEQSTLVNAVRTQCGGG